MSDNTGLQNYLPSLPPLGDIKGALSDAADTASDYLAASKPQSSFAALRPASFRGVAFEVASHTESGGRRLARHDYPLRDTPYAEDMGRKAGEWQVEAFLVRTKSADYPAARDALRKALSQGGPGTLIHPYFGEMTVAVESYTLHESTREGGYCTFSVTFVEPGHIDRPDVRLDTAGIVRSRALAAKLSIIDSFVARYAPLLEDMQDLAAFLPGLMAQGGKLLGAPLGLLSSVTGLAENVLSLPATLAGQLMGYLGTVRSMLPGSLSLDLGVLGELLGKRTDMPSSRWVQSRPGLPFLPGSGGGSSGGSGGSSGGDSGGGSPPELPDSSDAPALSTVILPSISNRAYTPLIDLVAAAAVIEAAEEAADTAYATADDALVARDNLLEAIDMVQAANATDAVYVALSDLRVAVQHDVATRSAALPRLATVRLPATMPALLASYRLYGNAHQADDIVARNRVRHPGRVPGGVALAILKGAV